MVDTSPRMTHLLARNLRGSPVRTTTVMVAVAVIVGLLFSTNVLTDALGHSSQIEAARLGADMIVLPPFFHGLVSYSRSNASISMVQQSSQYLPSYLAETISGLSGVAHSSPQLFAGTLNESVDASKQIFVVGFDPKTDFTVIPWLSSQDRPALSGEVAIAGASTGLRRGETIAWKGLALSVVATLDKTNSTLDESVFIPLASVYRASLLAKGTSTPLPFSPDQITGVLVKVGPSVSTEEVAQEIVPYQPDFKVVEASTVARSVGFETSGIATYGLVVAGVMALAVVVLIAAVFSLTVNERRRQLGLLRALGATRWFIFSSILEEVALITLIGGIFGLGLGEVVVHFGQLYLKAVFDVALLLPPTNDLVPLIVESLMLGVGIGALASTYPASVASVMDPYDAIRKGE